MSWDVNKQTYAEFYGYRCIGQYPEHNWEPQVQAVANRNLQSLVIPEHTIRFRFYNCWTAQLAVNGGSLNLFASSAVPESHSVWYYVNVVLLAPHEASLYTGRLPAPPRRLKRLDYLTDRDERAKATQAGYRCVMGRSRRVYLVEPKDVILSVRDPLPEELADV